MSKKSEIIIVVFAAVCLVALIVSGYVLNKRYMAEQIRAEAAVQKYVDMEAQFKKELSVIIGEKDAMKKVVESSNETISKLDGERTILKAEIAKHNEWLSSANLNSENFLYEYNSLRDNYNKLIKKDDEEILGLKGSIWERDNIIAKSEEAFRLVSSRLDSCNETLKQYHDSKSPRKMSVIEKVGVAGLVAVAAVVVVKMATK
jgi:hypothetical protein